MDRCQRLRVVPQMGAPQDLPVSGSTPPFGEASLQAQIWDSSASLGEKGRFGEDHSLGSGRLALPPPGSPEMFIRVTAIDIPRLKGRDGRTCSHGHRCCRFAARRTLHIRLSSTVSAAAVFRTPLLGAGGPMGILGPDG